MWNSCSAHNERVNVRNFNGRWDVKPRKPINEKQKAKKKEKNDCEIDHKNSKQVGHY